MKNIIAKKLKSGFRRTAKRLVAQQRGMTLIEIMVVITILGLIASLVGVAVLKRLEKAKVDTACTQIKMLGDALDQYKLDKGDYPGMDEGLEALVRENILKSKSVPKDPWGRDYIYQYPGTHNPDTYDLYSYGPDGREGGKQDITNWGPPCVK